MAHAHPAETVLTLQPPTAWIADNVLVGSLSKADFANYDGKYFEDDGKLYLLYSKRLESRPVAHDGIVAQRMLAPDLADRTLLLAPDTGLESLNSELFHTVPAPNDLFKLIETGNITRINGKYVMAYSAGDYQQKDYKTGLAYSDTLLPREGGQFRKNLPAGHHGHLGTAGPP
ncbi:MAG: hypothetical protein ACRYGF_10375 [Janthinobacterium lividum]